MTFPLQISLAAVIHFICFCLVCLHCLSHRREATSTLLWIFCSFFFPVIGPLLYITLGVDRLPQKAFKKKVRNDQLRQAREECTDALPLAYWRAVNADSAACDKSDEPEKSICAITGAVSDEFPLLNDNQIKSLVTGDELYPRMLKAIDNAKHHIHLQSFIIRNDKTGKIFMEHLAAKARQGIKVRLLYDRFGSTYAVLSGFFRHYRKVPNMQIAGWTQVNPLKRQFQLNLRNHRKTLIIDGTHAFLGGINLHDENCTKGNIPPIRDYHFELKGPVVQEVQYAFLRDWYFMTEEDPAIILQPVYFPAGEGHGNVKAGVVCGGPTHELQTIADLFFMAITRAQKQVLIVTPYFVPPPDILRALRSAAIRGVDVRLIVPQNNNHFYAGWAGRALYEELLHAGVRIFERTGPFIHAKAMLVDDEIAFVGSANWDDRSFRLNYEIIMTVINESFANELKRIILDDEAMSIEIRLESWVRRPYWHRLAENACSLLSPIL